MSMVVMGIDLGRFIFISVKRGHKAGTTIDENRGYPRNNGKIMGAPCNPPIRATHF